MIGRVIDKALRKQVEVSPTVGNTSVGAGQYYIDKRKKEDATPGENKYLKKAAESFEQAQAKYLQEQRIIKAREAAAAKASISQHVNQEPRREKDEELNKQYVPSFN